MIFKSDTNKVSFLDLILNSNYFLGNASADQKSMNSNLWSHFKEGEVMVMVFNANFRDSITFYQEFRYDGFWIYKEDGELLDFFE
jgi:hypothetical protein